MLCKLLAVKEISPVPHRVYEIPFFLDCNGERQRRTERQEGKAAGTAPERAPAKADTARAVTPPWRAGRLKDEGQGGGGLPREGARDTALACGGAAESTRSRRAAVRGRARDRQQGRGRVGRGGKKERRETLGRAPTWLGRRPPRGTPPVGEGTRDEHRSSDSITSALMACPHAGRRVKKKQQGQESTDRAHRGKGGRGGPKKKGKKTHNALLRAHNIEQAGCGRKGRSNRCTGQEKEPRASDSG